MLTRPQPAHLFLLLIGELMLCAVAKAQATDPWKEARFHFGPLALAPSISLANLGIDTNVFAAADDPQRDWTAIVTPGTRVIMRMGSARLTGQGEATYQYFREFSSERSLSTRVAAQIDIPLSRLQLVFGGTNLNSRQRQGAEITARVRRYETGFNAGAALRLGGQATLGVGASRMRYAFPRDEEFLDTNLRRVLARDEDKMSLTFGHRLTALTTFRLIGEAQADRFAFSPERNTESLRVLGGFDLSPDALLKGSAFVGYQRYTPAASAIPAFSGAVAAINISYVFLGATRFSARVDRSPSYSYDVREPYYIITGGGGDVAQHLIGRWELLATASRQNLKYRRLINDNESGIGRSDWSISYGAGLAYGFGRSGRIRVNGDRTERHSALATQDFHSWQITNSLDYAF